MSKETIEIKTSKEKFFLEYLVLKKPVIDNILTRYNNGNKKTLSDAPRRVLAQLLYFNDKFRSMEDSKRYANTFSKETKNQICDNLNIKEHYLNIYISQLRKLKIIDGKRIKNIFVIYAEDSHMLNFTFKLNGYSQ